MSPPLRPPPRPPSRARAARLSQAAWAALPSWERELRLLLAARPLLVMVPGVPVAPPDVVEAGPAHPDALALPPAVVRAFVAPRLGEALAQARAEADAGDAAAAAMLVRWDRGDRVSFGLLALIGQVVVASKPDLTTGAPLALWPRRESLPEAAPRDADVLAGAQFAVDAALGQLRAPTAPRLPAELCRAARAVPLGRMRVRFVEWTAAGIDVPRLVGVAVWATEALVATAGFWDWLRTAVLAPWQGELRAARRRLALAHAHDVAPWLSPAGQAALQHATDEVVALRATLARLSGPTGKRLRRARARLGLRAPTRRRLPRVVIVWLMQELASPLGRAAVDALADAAAVHRAGEQPAAAAVAALARWVGRPLSAAAARALYARSL